MKQPVQSPENREINPLWGLESRDLNKVLRRMLHRRALEFHQRLRQVRAKLQNNRQRLVFDYILDCTIGFNKLSDPIALSQFEQGKRDRETGAVIDSGCGLSHNPIRQAKKELVTLGLIIEEKVADERGASKSNRYTIRFVLEMVQAEVAYQKMKHLKRDTGRGYQFVGDTIKLPTEVVKQRCKKPSEKKTSKPRKPHMDPEHVDYLISRMEQVTGDTRSRGAFAQIALTVDESRIMELLSLLKDRRNINNKGAWFFAVAKKYQRTRVIKADDPEPPRPMCQKTVPAVSEMSYRQWIHQHKAALFDKLSIPTETQLSTQGQRTLNAAKATVLRKHGYP